MKLFNKTFRADAFAIIFVMKLFFFLFFSYKGIMALQTIKFPNVLLTRDPCLGVIL